MVNSHVLHIGAAPPKVRAAPGAFQAILDEVFGRFAVPHQRDRVSPQMRNLLDDQTAPVLIHARLLPGPSAKHVLDT